MRAVLLDSDTGQSRTVLASISREEVDQVRTDKLVELMGDEQIIKLGKEAPLGYVADPMEIANAIVYLTTDKASFVNGAILNVDGGRTAI